MVRKAALLLGLVGLVFSHNAARTPKFSVDVYHAVPESVEYQNSSNLLFQPSTFTLLHGPTSAILIDAPATINHSNQLAQWIEATIPGKKLTDVYITHGHGDHFFGTTILQKKFPGLRVRVTPGVYEHMKEQIDPSYFNAVWGSLFPGQLPAGLPDVEILPANHEFYMDGQLLRSVEVGQGDVSNATVLHVPSLDLVITGDVVYGNCFQSFLDTNTPTLQDAWLASIDKVKALKPKVVIPGHARPEEGYGSQHLDATKQYINDWKAAVKVATSWQKLEQALQARHPERTGSFILRISAQSVFNATF